MKIVFKTVKYAVMTALGLTAGDLREAWHERREIFNEWWQTADERKGR
jgi:hypothetical protein